MNTLRNFFIMVFILLITMPLQAQKYGKGLIFNEVYMNIKNPDKNWVEVYNPTGKILILEGFYDSHIRTGNVMPAHIRRQGGVVIKPDEYWIFCAYEKEFKDAWGKKKNVVVLKSLRGFYKGGFIRLFTRGLGEAGYDAFRYGAPESSSRYASSYGNQVLSFSKDDNSYSRKIEKTAKDIKISDFYETDPTPGKRNKEK